MAKAMTAMKVESEPGKEPAIVLTKSKTAKEQAIVKYVKSVKVPRVTHRGVRYLWKAARVGDEHWDMCLTVKMRLTRTLGLF